MTLLIQFGDIVCRGKENGLHGTVKEIWRKTEEYLLLNKLTSNTKNTEFIFFSPNCSQLGFFLHKNKIFLSQKFCRYLDIQMEGNLDSDKQLSKTLENRAHAIRLTHLIKHKFPNMQIFF